MSETTVICPECQSRVGARPATGGLLMHLPDHAHGCDRAGTVKTDAEIDANDGGSSGLNV